MIKLERIHILSRTEKLQPLRQLVHGILGKLECSDEHIQAIVLAVNEACMNVIQHAYHNRDDGEIIIEFYKENNELIIRIIDYADKVDMNLIKSRNLDDVRPGGLGVYFISQLMEHVEYKNLSSETGNLLEMRKHIFP